MNLVKTTFFSSNVLRGKCAKLCICLIFYLGSEKADVVNCKTGGTLEKMDIGTFWRGFESVKGNLFHMALTVVK